MCGLLGIATGLGRQPSVSDETVERLRDLMVHRGPDGAGLLRRGNVVLAHRRLAVIDPGPSGAQPMCSPDGRFALVYNGELYNDDEVRAALVSEGVVFQSACDTETVLWAIATWGRDGLSRLRGMFAIAFHDRREHRLLLARDPLGIKPLYYCLNPSGTSQLLFASEPGPLLRHPDVSIRPDLATISSYLTTIRVTMGCRTLFDGVRTCVPGESIEVDLSGDAPRLDASVCGVDGPSGSERVWETVDASVRAHLRSDVSACALLSGGLDSAAIVSRSCEALSDRATEFGAGWGRDRPVRTYCAGAPAGDFRSEDLPFARRFAGQIGTDHTEVPIDEALFLERWCSLIDRTGVPLSTPNEVAINEVARVLRARGDIVTLTGEGADELFGGYDLVLEAARRFEAAVSTDVGVAERARFLLDAAAWTPISAKPALLRDAVWGAVEQDAALQTWATETFELASASCEEGADPLEPHLRFIRRTNLTGLLRRLDSATMLESVEGRTPLADVHVARLAGGLRMERKFMPAASDAPGAQPSRSKIALREAFADELPPWICERPKASFPLPFEQWIGAVTDRVRGATLVRELLEPEAVTLICSDPARHWQLAWPVFNLALWGDRWWS